MAHSTASRRLLGLAREQRCSAPRLNRLFATAVDAPATTTLDTPITPPAAYTNAPTSPGRVLTTLHSWPELEPRRFTWYSSQHLDMPLRKDILHRAVIYEADVHRGMSTASTENRRDVHGSNRKIQQQKGTGNARVGDKKSPIRRGGGIAFGPHPRDFSSELPRKIYDIAWRTALSYRYRKGELIVLDNQMGIPLDATPRLLKNIFVQHKWGQEDGRSLLVSDRVSKSPLSIKSKETEELAMMQERLFEAMAQVGNHGIIKDLEDVDVKDLLEKGRVIIDHQSLDTLLNRHSADLSSSIAKVC